MKAIFNTLMFALFLVILPVTVKAQGEAMISGKILSTEKEIVDFATVYLKGTNLRRNDE